MSGASGPLSGVSLFGCRIPLGPYTFPGLPPPLLYQRIFRKNPVLVSRVLTGQWRRRGSPSSGVALAGLLRTAFSGAQLLVRQVSHTRLLQSTASSGSCGRLFQWPAPAEVSFRSARLLSRRRQPAAPGGQQLPLAHPLEASQCCQKGTSVTSHCHLRQGLAPSLWGSRGCGGGRSSLGAPMDAVPGPSLPR